MENPAGYQSNKQGGIVKSYKKGDDMVEKE
jgi:hypothetical protein